MTRLLPPRNPTGKMYSNFFLSFAPLLSFETALRPHLPFVSNTPEPLLCPCARENRLVRVYNLVKLLGKLTMTSLSHSGQGSVLR